MAGARAVRDHDVEQGLDRIPAPLAAMSLNRRPSK
jgi:hypothetical protein